MRTFISVEEARALIFSSLPGPIPETVDLALCAGRTLLEDIHSDVDSPPFDNSAMDGFAVQGVDVAHGPSTLRITGEVAAGSWPTVSVGPGDAVRIMTGAPVPDGADTVIPVEWTSVRGDQVNIDRAARPGQHVREQAQDIRTGQLLLKQGLVIGAGAMGLLATAGRSSVTVGKVPKVAVVTTGDEVVPVDVQPKPGQLRNSNAWALAAQVESAGGRAAVLLHALDNLESLASVLEQAANSDAIVISGGVSMGEYDLVRVALDRLGFDAAFWKVRQRPGKPLAFGRLGSVPVFGLPGNPVSSSVCFDQYVRPSIARMLGRAETDRPRFTATLDHTIKKVQGLHFFARGTVRTNEDGALIASPTGPQGSNLFTSVQLARAILHLPADWETADPGMHVQVEWVDW